MDTMITWTPERDDELTRRYVAEGATALAKEWGVTKNAVVGRASRLALTGTPGARATSPNKPKEPRLNPPGSCQWPIGDPRDRDFHLCGTKATVGKPYCGRHMYLAYRRS